jgi:UDP-3-O-acyl-N-acetylglucosamine deacetylase
MGDLSLLGQDLEGHLVGYRSGHVLNIELARTLQQQMTMQPDLQPKAA